MKFMEAVEACFKGKKCSTDRHSHIYYMAYQNGKLYWFNKSDDKLLGEVNVGPWLDSFKDATFEIYEKLSSFEVGVLYKFPDGRVFIIIDFGDSTYSISNIGEIWYSMKAGRKTSTEVLDFLNRNKCVRAT